MLSECAVYPIVRMHVSHSVNEATIRQQPGQPRPRRAGLRSGVQV